MLASSAEGAHSISVALCTYNGARFLREQLDSISGQLLQPSELVICDDGSHDRTMAIASEFAQIAAFPVHIYRNESRLGSTRNFDRAMSLCSGEFIALCDQDDIWLPEKIQRLASVLSEDASCGGVFSDGWLINDRGERLDKRLSQIGRFPASKGGNPSRRDLLRILLSRNIATGATMMVRASTRPLFSPIPADWVHDAWIAWMLVLHSKLLMVAEPLIYYRVHREQQLGFGGLTETGASSIMKRIEDTRRLGRRENCRIAENFTELRRRWRASRGNDYEWILSLLDGKIAFHRGRTRLPRGSARRAWHILRRHRDYKKYGNGMWSMAKDLFIMDERR